jgi:hypothetical protein
MKSFITPICLFTPGISGIGSINLFGIENFDIKRLIALINIRTNTIIYNISDSSAGYTSVSGSTITLSFNTSSMFSTDPIQVIYDNDDAITNNELIQAIESLRMAIQSLLRTGLGQSMPDTQNRLRVLTDTASSIGTVSTLSNQTNIGGFAASEQTPSLMRLSADSIRHNITTS